MGHDRAALLERLRRAPGRTALLLDFDGTLAPIVDDPALSVPFDGAPQALAALAHDYACVAVISGRPVRFLQRHLPGEVHLVGLYGLEVIRSGEVLTHPDALPWRPIVDEVAARAESELPAGVGVEHKGLSLTLHVRQDPSLAPDVKTWAADAAEQSGLQVRQARMSAELHPPVETDKGSAVAALLDGIDVACFIGDDVGDVPAFDALDAFAAGGGTAVRFVVESSELDPGLRARADDLLAGPSAVLDVLRALLV